MAGWLLPCATFAAEITGPSIEPEPPFRSRPAKAWPKLPFVEGLITRHHTRADEWGGWVTVVRPDILRTNFAANSMRSVDSRQSCRRPWPENLSWDKSARYIAFRVSFGRVRSSVEGSRT